MGGGTVNLYQVTQEIASLVERAIDLDTGEVIDADLDKLLDELEGERDARALNIGCAIIDYQAEAEKIATRAKELAARAKVLDNRAASLKRYLATNLPAGHKVADDRVSLSWRKSEACVVDVDVALLPSRYQRVSVTAATSEIKEALKSGEAEAARLAHLETRMNLQVK